jgi:hypothetical protein
MVLADKGGKKQFHGFLIPSTLDGGSPETSLAVVCDPQTSSVGLVVMESPTALVLMDKEEDGDVALCLRMGILPPLWVHIALSRWDIMGTRIGLCIVLRIYVMWWGSRVWVRRTRL